MAVANMAVEAGADTCVFEGDARSDAHMHLRGRVPREAVTPDPAAAYRQHVALDLGALSPVVACPPSPGGGVPVQALKGHRVDQVYVGNCANGTLTDLGIPAGDNTGTANGVNDVDQVVGQHPVPGPDPGSFEAVEPGQIGRASCRERVSFLV